jgi:hypothetical protein
LTALEQLVGELMLLKKGVSQSIYCFKKAHYDLYPEYPAYISIHGFASYGKWRDG